MITNETVGRDADCDPVSVYTFNPKMVYGLETVCSFCDKSISRRFVDYAEFCASDGIVYNNWLGESDENSEYVDLVAVSFEQCDEC